MKVKPLFMNKVDGIIIIINVMISKLHQSDHNFQFYDL